MTRVRNNRFDSGEGLDRGRPALIEAAWYIFKWLFFLTAFPVPSAVKRVILRLFGAQIGKGVIIKPRVNIHLPWKLTVGDFSWIGEEVFILNFEPVTIGSHCCVSQRAFLCTGNHDYRQAHMPYRNQPITIADGAWIGAQTFIAPGVQIATEAVVIAGSVVTKSQPARMVCAGNPCTPVKPRWTDALKPQERIPRVPVSFERRRSARPDWNFPLA